MKSGELASLNSRLVASLLDAFIFLVTILIAAPLFNKLTGLLHAPAAGGVLLVILFLNFEAVQVVIWGRTLGHRMCGLAVVNESGGKPNYLQAQVRWILKSLLGLFSFITMLSRGRAIHDTVTKTSVRYL